MTRLRALLLFVLPLFLPCGAFAQDESGYELTDEESEELYMDMDTEDRGITLYGIRDTTPQMQVIEREDIEKRQTPDLATLLEETLDIGITTKGAYGNKSDINIRGFNTERIGILINGVPANDPRTGEFDVSQIDLSNVERVEVIYGGSDSKYNVTGAMGGVINIITKKRQEPGWSFGGGISNTGYLTGDYNARGSDGQVGEARPEDWIDTQMVNAFAAYGGEIFSGKLNLSADSAGNHYLYKDDKGFARRKESNEVTDLGANFDFSYFFGDANSLSSTTDFFFANRHFPVTGQSVGFARTRDWKLKETLNLNMPLLFNDSFSTEALLDFALTDNKYGAVISSSDRSFTAINRWGWYPFPSLTVRAGLDWRYIRVDSTDNGEQNGNNGGAYLTVEYKPREPLTLVASVKGATDLDQTVAIPKGGFVWQIVQKGDVQFALKNNYFRTFKFPDFDDLFRRSFDGLYAGNPDLKPEDGFGFDATMEFVYADWFSISNTYYGQRNTDAIHWVRHGSRWEPQNIGFSVFYGGDIRPAFTFTFDKGPFERVKLGLNYQLQFSWLMTDDIDYANALRIPYMPMHIAGGSIDLDWKTGSFLVSAHWESLRFADVNNRMPLEPYCLVNATVNQDIGRHVTLSANVRNALNWLYTSFAEYPMPGLSVTLAARVRFTGLGKANSEE
jgi:outer membrane cobalamin receptor